MSALAGLGVLAALAAVVGLLLLGVHAAQRLGLTRAAAHPQLRVIRRLSLGTRQGIAVVRIGERILAVSVGDGGVRALQELSEAEAAALEEAPAGLPGDFAALLRNRLRRGTAALLLLVAVNALPAPLLAQGPAAAPPVAAGTTAVATSPAPGSPRVQLSLGSNARDGIQVTGAVGTVLVLGALTMLPAVLLLMTGFTRILIVLHLLRQALGTQTAPPGQLLTALALILTGFVMAPTLSRVNQEALQPWLDGRSDELTMLRNALVPLREFMLEHTAESDIDNFLELSGQELEPTQEVPTSVLAAAFTTSELRAAFKMGFAIFLPFVVIDLVVASVLSGMGMFMLPPTMIALPCKLLLFVLVDGWQLTVQSLVRSFGA